MNGKRRNQIGGIKPVGMPIPHRINQVIVKEFAFKTLVKLNPAAAKNIGVFARGVEASDERSDGREKEKEEFQGKFRKDVQKQKDGGRQWEQDGSS